MDSSLIVWLVRADTVTASAIVGVWIGWRAGPLRGFVSRTSIAGSSQGSWLALLGCLGLLEKCRLRVCQMLVVVNGGQRLMVVEMMMVVVIVEVRHYRSTAGYGVLVCGICWHPGVWPDTTGNGRRRRNRIDFIVGRTERWPGSVVKINYYVAGVTGGSVANRWCAASWHV